MSARRPLWLFAAAAFLICISFCVFAGEVSFQKDSLEIVTADKKIAFDIELATSSQQKAQGLMFRKELPEKSGMLFLSESEEIYTMWMKNTYVPLDMIFFNSAGVITKIEKNTTPESISVISSDSLVRGVLELGAGITDKYNINPGDRLIYEAFE